MDRAGIEPLVGVAPPAVRDVVRGEVRAAAIVAAFPTAVYLSLRTGDVIALLTRDAVLLPLGVRLPCGSSAQPLTAWAGPVAVGGSLVRAPGRTVRVTRPVDVSAPTGLEPDPSATAYAATGLSDLDVGPTADLLERLVSCPGTDVVARLLGAGPGLTPLGDDVLAGILVGGWSFGRDLDGLRSAVLAAAPARTNDLSAALLRCACRGESIPQLNEFLLALAARSPSKRSVDSALGRLVDVGHSSGVAMAWGAVIAARGFSSGADPHGDSPRRRTTTQPTCLLDRSRVAE